MFCLSDYPAMRALPAVLYAGPCRGNMHAMRHGVAHGPRGEQGKISLPYSIVCEDRCGTGMEKRYV